jgi:hypothetical protein
MYPLARFLIALALMFGMAVRPGKAELLENQIKSAYVLNFVKLAEWPAGAGAADDKLTLCVVGSNVLNGELSGLGGRKAGGRELRVVKHDNADGNLSGCHVVFIGESEQRRVIPIIKALGDSPTLTISDIDDFAEKGGCIGLRFRDNKIVFEVNLASAHKAQLRLPAQLLNLAYYVFGK